LYFPLLAHFPCAHNIALIYAKSPKWPKRIGLQGMIEKIFKNFHKKICRIKNNVYLCNRKTETAVRRKFLKTMGA
jgi:hypothetical protein